MGAFYPFSRNHNTIGTKDQDPGAMGPIVAEAARYALRLRYSLLPLLYTELYKASQDGRPVVKSLSLIWPEDESAYVEDQFLWGDSLMVLPILEEGKTERDVYLPDGLWYDYPTMELLNKNNTNGSHITVKIPLERIRLAIRGGSILFTQKAEMTTYETRQNKFTLNVALDANGQAEGDLYVDDGESVIDRNHRYSFLSVKSSSKSIKLSPIVNLYQIALADRVQICGPNLDSISTVYVNGDQVDVKVKQLNPNAYLLENLSLNLNQNNEIKWN